MHNDYLEALECPQVADLVRRSQTITDRQLLKQCDPTAVLRLAALTDTFRTPIFPQFTQAVSDLLHCDGVPLKLTLSSSKPIKLFTHQLKALRFLRHCDTQIAQDPEYTKHVHGVILVLKMGLGKTLVAMTYACMLPKPPQHTRKFPTLVVASKTVMTMWQLDGFEKFMQPNKLKILYLHKNWMTKDEIDNLDRDTIVQYDFVVTTYDVVLSLARKHPDTMQDVLQYGRAGVWGENPNSVKNVFVRTRRGADRPDWTGLKVLYGTPWHLVIADESQRFANPKTKTFRAMMGLYGYRKLCLTGTPIRNYKTDLWAQLRWMGYRGILKSQHWRPLYMKYHNLNSCILSIDYPDTDIVMPSKHTKQHKIELSQLETRIYNFVHEKTIEALDQMLARKLDFVCVLALFTRLRQVCIAPHLITSIAKRDSVKNSEGYAQQVLAELKADGPLWSIIKNRNGPAGMGSSKIQAIVEEIRAIPPREKVLVFSTFTSALDLIAGALDGLDKQVVDLSQEKSVVQGSLFDELPPAFMSTFEPSDGPIGYEQLDGATVDRASVLRRFKQDPHCKVLLITYKVGSEGLNLTEANHAILVEPWWTYSVPDQAAGRIWRPGQTRDVTIHNLIAHETIENHVIAICNQKRAMEATYLGGATTLSEAVDRANSRLNVHTMRRILGR